MSVKDSIYQGSSSIRKHGKDERVQVRSVSSFHGKYIVLPGLGGCKGSTERRLKVFGFVSVILGWMRGEAPLAFRDPSLPVTKHNARFSNGSPSHSLGSRRLQITDLSISSIWKNPNDK